MQGSDFGNHPNYGTIRRGNVSPSRLSEDESTMGKLNEYVSTGNFRSITALLKKKRFTTTDLLKREIRRLKSSPPEVPLVESVRDFDNESSDEEDDLLTKIVDNDQLLPPGKSWNVSFEEENTSRLLIYAKQEWKHTQKLAVEASVAELIMHSLPRRQQENIKTLSVAEIAKRVISIEGTELQLLELIHEFVADGFEPAQNALLAAVCSVDYDDDNDKATADVDRKDLFIRFLFRYIKMENNSLSSTLVSHYQNRALSIVQLLCENHHEMWQSVVALEVDGTLLFAVVEVLDKAATTTPNSLVVHKCLEAITEACQGPNTANQELMVESKATAICCKLLMNDQAVEMTIHQAATELLLSLMEGRSDQVTQATVAHEFTADFVVQRLQLYFRSLIDQFGYPLDFGKHDIHRAPVYKKAMNLITIASRIMSLDQVSGNGEIRVSEDADQDELNEAEEAEDRHTFEVHMRAKLNTAVLKMLKRSESDPSTLTTAIKTVLVANRALRAFDTRSVQGFRSQWETAIAQNKAQAAIRFFNSQIISVEIVRYGKPVTVYFVKPSDAMYFDEQLQNDLLDEMDIGSERAMDVLLSEKARDTEEELKVVKHLKRLKLYSLMSTWQLWLRTRLLALCFYINFVIILKLTFDGARYQFVTILGAVYAALSGTLFIYYLLRTFNFNYCKQQISMTKLRFRSPKTIRDRKWEAFKEPIFYFELFVWTYSLIVWVYGWDALSTQVLGLFALGTLLYTSLRSFREYAEIERFSVNQDITFKEIRVTIGQNLFLPKVYFWYNVLYDTLFSEIVLRFLIFTTCAILGLVDDARYFLYYGVPLYDLVNLNYGLRFVAKATNANMSKISITAAFGGLVIYFFALIGFEFFQAELTDESEGPLCNTLMHCAMTYLHSGLLNGGGIGDYLSDHPLNYSHQVNYFGRVFYDLAFFIVVIVLILNLIQGIIIDAFTAVREASENKMMLRRQQCIVCNRSRSIIEAEGMQQGIMNSFTQHVEVKHNLFNYFFFIKYLNSKDETDMNGIESFVFDKLKLKDMSWVPHI
ncbi:inositol 1,4,5-triphosphate receptor [Thraustotheca clavata]|uniref:Inositol 1,4,5-triphosphate receptor n=1 Tax=Thraustotheca clavata TaxID=74557 RepID=A0A1V9ZLR7_9STRA|nr:inositol 1,4,5-triphosphate receptor [Thraustotheca clavata]